MMLHLIFNVVHLVTLSLLKTTVMIFVHDIFICKPGNASKLAKKFKEGMTGMEGFVHVMTDLVGQYNKVVVVSRYENLSAYEQSFKDYMQQAEQMKKMQEAMEGYHDMYFTGSREIYQVAS
jgi:heme-degrading monooxygenase HmoA